VKEQSNLIAQVMVMSLMSQPVFDEVGTCFLSLPDPSVLMLLLILLFGVN